jgi:DNA mismatch endonuclease (patch repair protein)
MISEREAPGEPDPVGLEMKREMAPHSSGRPLFEGVTAGRRRNMQANRGKNTKPEMTVRRMLHGMGYRFRLHIRALPGCPDVVFAARRRVVEIRGCFWHGHGCHPLGQIPKSRKDYWEPKIAGNKARDGRNLTSLNALGWKVLELWECEIRSRPDEIAGDLVSFLGPVRISRLGAGQLTRTSPGRHRPPKAETLEVR